MKWDVSRRAQWATKAGEVPVRHRATCTCVHVATMPNCDSSRATSGGMRQDQTESDMCQMHHRINQWFPKLQLIHDRADLRDQPVDLLPRSHRDAARVEQQSIAFPLEEVRRDIDLKYLS